MQKISFVNARETICEQNKILKVELVASSEAATGFSFSDKCLNLRPF